MNDSIHSYRMPGEFEPHRGTLLIWPVRPGSWPQGGAAAQQVFCRLMEELLQGEEVFLLSDPTQVDEVRTSVPSGVSVLPIPTDDAWARDVGPTFVTTPDGEVLGVDWAFNAWGGTVDGLYAHWERDDRAAAAFCQALGYPVLDAHPFVLEGGSIHSDGEGTLMTTGACLLSAGRNPGMSRQEIEDRLCSLLGGEKVLWLPRGIYLDETNEHVDNICAFVRPGEVVLAWTDDETDPQYPLSMACLSYLEGQRDAKGRPLIIHKLPIPKTPVTLREEEVSGYVFEEGEEVRTPGERLAASYVNFYIANRCVLLPQFGDPMDRVATDLLSGLFPERTIVPIPARDILVGGGNIHCITQQIPKGGILP